jgi:hypothetical protein
MTARDRSRRFVSLLVCVPLVGIVATASSYAHADAAHAADQYRAGADAYARGAYRAAAEMFEAAFREDPRAASIYNAGIAWEAGGDAARAADAYATALATRDLREPQRTDATERITALEKKLGRVDATGPSTARIAIAHAEGRALPAQVHLAPGSYSLHATYADGHAESRDVQVAAGQSVALDLTPLIVAPPVVTPPAAPSEPVPAPTEPSSSSSSLRTIGWIGVGGAVVLSGLAVYSGLTTLSARDAFSGTGDTNQSDHDRAVSARMWTNVAWTAAGVVGATGVVLLLVAPSSRGSTGARASVVVGPGAVGVRGSF